ncbi:hypothetical protein DC522_07750 [Microvirga sp. KLBC 81]|uniref:hypothetical protein n=1 Tax=Microvirga sp. KLBC 81 TaxID=1862707 RepID=UPI000D517C6C|nr:hypothetical protein [Microvirga sp. KLBC 81]PVE25095.1 hypothetical protein DC522_07750 [Microvirga sp. KLBC 81]
MNGRDVSTSKRLATELLAGALISLSLLGPAFAQSRTAESLGMVADTNVPDHLGASSNLQHLLQVLLTTSDRIQFAEKLEASVREGDLSGAENSLNAAIEIGSLAILLNEHLRDPNFLAILEAAGIRGASASSPNPTEETALPATCSAPATSAGSNAADLQMALEQEQSNSSMISTTLNDLMQENNALKTRLEMEAASKEAKASEMQQALRKEQERVEAVMRELASLQAAYQTLQEMKEQDKPAPPPNTVELETRLRQEREQRDNAVHQLASMEQELRALQLFKNEAIASESARVTELRNALAQERIRRDTLTKELTHVLEQLRTLREPYQPSATPLVFRMAGKGMDAPLPQAQENIQPQKISSPPQIEAAPQDITSALPRRESAPVVVASLPDNSQPLPVAPKPLDQMKASPQAEIKNTPADTVKADDRFVARAEELLSKGDVSGARLLLERSLASGNPRAAFLMAETFDPNVLSRLRVLGIRGDVAKAQEFYARARALGIAQAGERMEALK